MKYIAPLVVLAVATVALAQQPQPKLPPVPQDTQDKLAPMIAKAQADAKVLQDAYAAYTDDVNKMGAAETKALGEAGLDYHAYALAPDGKSFVVRQNRIQ